MSSAAIGQFSADHFAQHLSSDFFFTNVERIDEIDDSTSATDVCVTAIVAPSDIMSLDFTYVPTRDRADTSAKVVAVTAGAIVQPVGPSPVRDDSASVLVQSEIDFYFFAISPRFLFVLPCHHKGSDDRPLKFYSPGGMVFPCLRGGLSCFTGG